MFRYPGRSSAGDRLEESSARESRDKSSKRLAETERVSLAIESDLLSRFDALIEKSGHGNRSEAMRDLMRNRLIEEEWATSTTGEAVATVTLVYDHTKRELADR